jgi:hypothetical protein
MTTRAMFTAHAPSPAQPSGWRGADWHHAPSVRTATRVLGDVAIIATTLTLVALIAAMLFAPMLP